MGFFDNMKDRAVDLAQAGVAQSKRLAEIAKLKTANMGEEDTIKKAYIELGKLYYAEKGASPGRGLCGRLRAHRRRPRRHRDQQRPHCRAEDRRRRRHRGRRPL